MSILYSVKSYSPFHIPGKKLAHLRDEYRYVTVIENRDYLILTFDTIYEQSKILKAAPPMPVHHYIRAILMVPSFTPVEKVLILGLGGGCLVRAINAYNNKTIMDIVELREVVMSLAKEYFSLPEEPRNNYYIQDANAFMGIENKAAYDIIFSDLYSEDAMIPLQSKGSFLVSCTDRFTDNGWLVMNYHPP